MNPAMLFAGAFVALLAGLQATPRSAPALTAAYVLMVMACAAAADRGRKP